MAAKFLTPTKGAPLFWGAALVCLAMVWPGGAAAYRHHTSSIDYQDYSQAAFDQARRENKPVFMVLSAVWCYWCKIYDARTLETKEVSAFLNRNFVNVFVDLDRHQNLQHLYVKRGIPTSVIFTPAGKKFLSFSGLLEPKEFLSGISLVLERIRQGQRVPVSEPAPNVSDVRPLLEEALAEGATLDWKQAAGMAARRRREFLALVTENFDEEFAGFGRGKKYPLGPLLRYLLENYRDTGDKAVLAVALKTLNRAIGALYDPVDGGFFRYAARRNWGDPRYEKMLLTNVNLIRACQLAAVLAPPALRPAGSPDYDAVFRHSLDFLLKTFYRKQGGGFYGSLDGKNPAFYRQDSAGRAAMKKPRVDQTMFSAWNGEAIHLLFQVQQASPSPRLRRVLESSSQFLLTRLGTAEGGMVAYRQQGRAQGLGSLNDNAWGAMAFVAAFRLTGRADFREGLRRTLAYARTALLVPGLRVFRRWNVPHPQGLRRGEALSQEVPLGGNGLMAFALLNAYEISGEREYVSLAQNIIARLLTLEPELFDEDPADGGKLYLTQFVYYLKSLKRLKLLDT